MTILFSDFLQTFIDIIHKQIVAISLQPLRSEMHLSR